MNYIEIEHITPTHNLVYLTPHILPDSMTSYCSKMSWRVYCFYFLLVALLVVARNSLTNVYGLVSRLPSSGSVLNGLIQNYCNMSCHLMVELEGCMQLLSVALLRREDWSTSQTNRIRVNVGRFSCCVLGQCSEIRDVYSPLNFRTYEVTCVRKTVTPVS